MEERIIDKDDERLIRLKRTAEGETDAQDETAPEGVEPAEEEVVVELPEGEYDEDLVGLTPSQLQRELERRRKAEEEARAECEKLVTAAEELLLDKKFEEAEPLFAQAATYPFAQARVYKGLWNARTKDFADPDVLLHREYAEEIASSDEEVKAYVRERCRGLEAERENAVREEAETAPAVLERQEKRRGAFLENRKFYSVRTLALFAGAILLLIGAAVSASFIVKTLSIAPVVLTGVFGGAAFLLFVCALLFLRKYVVAQRLYRANESLFSTEEGSKLEALREKIECMNLILDDETAESEEDTD